MRTKQIPYSRQSIDLGDIREVVRVLKSDWITQGPKIREFEQALCRYTGAKYAVAVSSGTAALHISISALGIGKGDEVITSPITFSASANCALYAGARPQFVDIDDETYHLGADKLREYLRSPSGRRKIKAVIPVHFMGTVADIHEIRKICDKYGIKIIEDAAHAIGAGYKTSGRWAKVGRCRDSEISIFSFHPIKHITAGEGGAILTNNRKIYEKALRFRHHGIVKKRRDFWAYDIPRVGYNYRITDFQCALALSQLKRLDSGVRCRREIVRFYNKSLSGIGEIRLPRERKDTFASYHLYVIRISGNKRDGLYRYLRKNGIFTQVNYIPVHLFSYYRKIFGYKQGDFPVAERYFRECLSLPVYTGLSIRDCARVIKKIREYFKR